MKRTLKNILKAAAVVSTIGTLSYFGQKYTFLEASSHREAPLIANDPLADNTDLYVFRSPEDTNKVTIIANYVPFENPDGGPNYHSFGENIRYEVHVKNNAATAGDDITYRFTFTKVNQDPTTFFNIRLGMQNLKTSYKLEKKMAGGSFITIVANGTVPPPNIGPRSIETGVGLTADYNALMTAAITTASTGEMVFAGPVDDPFFVDLGAIFDLGAVRPAGQARDGLAKYNCHTIALQIPVSSLQKDGKNSSMAANILDPDYVIGVWASASRRQIRTLNTDGSLTDNGDWVQVSRLGMPLTNEAVIPIGGKDKWNALTPYNEDTAQNKYFMNPELALYMDDSQFGGAVPGLAPLRIQTNSLGAFDFRNGKAGLSGLKGNPALDGTALADAAFGGYLLRNNRPRSVDLLPIFHTGVPNLRPYQLATGKTGGPLSAGKPFINNFLPTFGDMIRLNMAVPVTPRNSPDFSSLGLVGAAVLGLTDSRFNGSAALQNIPNMDGFPNGRRLEDDVTRIELQAVGGVVLAAIGLWYDDYPGTGSPVTPNLLSVLGFNTGVTANDTTFRSGFPYLQTPWRGYEKGGRPFVNPLAISSVAVTPFLAPGGGTYGGPQNVVLTTMTPGATILYTTNGNVPQMGTGFTKVYSGPISVLDNTTIRAVATKSGIANSPVAVGVYTITNPGIVAVPVISPNGGTFNGSVNVTLSTTTSGASVYYTTSGNLPVVGTSFTKLYSAPFTLYGTTTVRAMGVKTGLANSAVAAANFVVNSPSVVAAPTFNPAPGSYPGPISVSISSTTPGTQIYFTTNGITPSNSTPAANLYSAPFNLSQSITLKAIAYKTGFQTSTVSVGSYTIAGGGARVAVAGMEGQYYEAIDAQNGGNLVNLTVYPNPSTGKFKVETEGKTGTAELKVMNMVGQQIWKGSISVDESEAEVDISRFAPGIYTLQFKSGSVRKEMRITKQ